MIEMYVDYGHSFSQNKGVIACVVNSDKGIDTYTKVIEGVASHNGELAAVIFAMTLARSRFTHEKVEINTDQMCIVRAINNGEPLKYRRMSKHDSLKERVKRFNKLYKKNKEQFVFQKVKSHAKCLGHNYADILAGMELNPNKAHIKKCTNIENKVQRAVTKANPPKAEMDIYQLIAVKVGQLLNVL